MVNVDLLLASLGLIRSNKANVLLDVMGTLPFMFLKLLILQRPSFVEIFLAEQDPMGGGQRVTRRQLLSFHPMKSKQVGLTFGSSGGARVTDQNLIITPRALPPDRIKRNRGTRNAFESATGFFMSQVIMLPKLLLSEGRVPDSFLSLSQTLLLRQSLLRCARVRGCLFGTTSALH